MYNFNSFMPTKVKKYGYLERLEQYGFCLWMIHYCFFYERKSL